MSKSKFLEYQDTDDSGLVDACDELTNVPEEKTCPTCQKNLNYMAPDWKTKDEDEPWLNEKICKYQITIVTNEKSLLIPITTDELSTGDNDNITSIFEEYREQAIDGILTYFDKDNSSSSIESLSSVVEFEKYDLDIRANSRVKLLYSIPFENVAMLQNVDQAEQDEENQDEEEDSESNTVASKVYDAENFNSNVLKVRKALNMYGTYLKVFRSTQRLNIVFEEQNTIFNLKRYGDNGITGTGTLEKVVKDIDKFLSKKGYLLRGGSARFSGLGKDIVNKISFGFTNKYQLKYIKIVTQDCGDKQIMFRKNKIKSLTKKGHFKDKTAMAYLSRIDKMVEDLMAREPASWSDFVIAHTYPKVVVLENWPFNGAPPSAPSCVGEALLAEGKQLGQDILDIDFNLADSILYETNKIACRDNVREVIRERQLIGLYPETSINPGGNDLLSLDVRSRNSSQANSQSQNTIFALAKEQAFREIELSDPVFASLCGRMLGFASENEIPTDRASIFRDFIDNIKLCGLKDLLVESTNCILAAIPFEKAMSKIVKSALQNMSVVNFGRFMSFLPVEDQRQIQQKVLSQLDQGNIFKEDSTNQRLSNYISSGVTEQRISNIEPWTIPSLVQKIGDMRPLNSSHNLRDSDTNNNRRTLLQNYQQKSASLEQQTGLVMELYLHAIIEYFENDFFSVLEVLNRFPGSQLIAKAILLSDCPQPPLFSPSIMDFIRDIELPFCRGINDITLPSMRNPLGWIPRLNDITGELSASLNINIQRILISIISKLLVKVCNLIGSSICETLKATGNIVGNLGNPNNRDAIIDTIRESICGTEASDQQVENTVVDIFNKLGLGAAAMADTEKLLQFTGDLASSLTRKEMMDMFLGNPSDQALTVSYEIIEQEHPEYIEALPSKEAVADLMGNIGNLMPADHRRRMSDFSNDLDGDDFMPANPQLCATPEDIENFRAYRCGQLADRASSEQCEIMSNNFQDELAEKLEDITNALQQGPSELIKNSMPPIISDPGCDNGIVPFEAPVVTAAKNKSMDFVIKQIFLDFSTDMLGNGPGEKNWGLLNMILSDTMGIPLTAHYRKSFNRRDYVDFLTEDSSSDDQGQFPLYVAEWLQQQLSDMNTVVFNTNNEFQEKETLPPISFNNLGVSLYSPLNVLELPDFGFGVNISVDAAAEEVIVTKNGRKASPDLEMEFTDNNKGRRSGFSDYENGFTLKLFLSDLHKQHEEQTSATNIPMDTARIKITNLLNTGANRGFNSVQEEEEYEFISSDNTFNFFNIDEYPNFQKSFLIKTDYIPQLVLLHEMVEQKGYTGTVADLKNYYDESLSQIFQNVTAKVAENKNAFLYGAKFDDLSEEDADYVVQEGQTDSPAGTLYGDATIDGKKLTNENAILGISRNQLEDRENTRVFYLDPAQFGGNYVNPPVYIKPLQNEGWLGLIDIMFPELSPCKPSKTDLVDFGEISNQFQKTLDNVPLDERLKFDEDCVVELPYNRVLERESIAGIQAVITAACRIYSSAHFIKSMATFTTFKPDFDNVYSSLYPQYIVENMEKEFKNVQAAFWERLNPFKDEEFWYSFLEQSVQTYARLVDEGKIVEIPSEVYEAIEQINNMQEEYKFPTKQDWKNSQNLGSDLGKAFVASLIPLPGSGPAAFAANFETYKEYKERLNFEAIKATEEQAKIVLKEMVKKELQYMANKFLENLKNINIEPTYTDTDWYILSEFTNGGIDLDLNKEIVAVADEEPSGPSYGMTSNVANHMHTYEVDEDGNGWAYTAYHPSDQRIKHKHQIINWEVQEGKSDCYPDCKSIYENDGVGPHVHNISRMIVPIGDVESYDFVPESVNVPDSAKTAIDVAMEVVKKAESELMSDSSNDVLKEAYETALTALQTVFATFGINMEQYFTSLKPFVIEKYINIGGVKYGIEEGTEIIKSNPAELNISDIYPGTLELVYALGDITQETEDSIGVRQQYSEEDDSKEVVGLKGEFGVRHGLQFSIFVDGQKFEITSVEIDALDYKINSFVGIQANSKELLCLLKMLKQDQKFKMVSKYIFPTSKIISTVAIYNDMAFLQSIGEVTVSTNPGMKVIFDENGEPDYSDSNPGWADYETRKPGFLSGLGVREWDNWDQQLLSNSKSRLKSLFRTFYNSRNFESNFESMFQHDPIEFSIGQIKAGLRPDLTKAVLPRWRRRNSRTNPFNSNGTLCEKKETS